MTLDLNSILANKYSLLANKLLSTTQTNHDSLIFVSVHSNISATLRSKLHLQKLRSLSEPRLFLKAALDQIASDLSVSRSNFYRADAECYIVARRELTETVSKAESSVEPTIVLVLPDGRLSLNYQPNHTAYWA